MLKVALLDDYANAALASADWRRVAGAAELTVFDRHLSEAEAAAALAPFDVLSTIRERMALPASLLARLPNLKMIVIIGPSLPNLDMAAATANGVLVCTSDLEARRPLSANATPELTWGLLIAAARHLTHQERVMRAGGWQTKLGTVLAGRTLGLLGLGRIGARVAEYGRAFGMDVIAWSQNLTAEAAAAQGARRVEKDDLFRLSDALSIHTRLSERTRGLITARELDLMKPTALLINTSRGPIVVERDLIAALQTGVIAGAGLDVFDIEPLPADHPFRAMDNITLAPHLGYSTHDTLANFYGDTLAAIEAYAAGKPIRIANPEALAHPKQKR